VRVISGKAKGRRLKRVPGDSTRPIMDRVKENLFNLLSGAVAGSHWLDLFAGTGQVGIEALSRGAASVIFVDKVRAAIQTVSANLKHTQLSEGAKLVQADAFAYLKKYSGPPFDLVFVAPPQYQELWVESMNILDARCSRILAPNGLVVVQIDPKEFVELELTTLSVVDRRRYGNTELLFYAVASSNEKGG
jgi:16S rRNA (guanine966-N2)-methyltransferase